MTVTIDGVDYDASECEIAVKLSDTDKWAIAHLPSGDSIYTADNPED